MRRHSSSLFLDVGAAEQVRAPTLNHVSITVPAMKSLAAVVLLVLVSTGCSARVTSGGARNPARTDTTQQQDHGDFSRPIGQR
jgi:hypothetical protein